MEDLMIAQQDGQIRVDFASSLQHLECAVPLLMTFAQQAGVPCTRFALELVLREGLTNAVIHGNRLDLSRWVQCEMRTGPDTLRITIADQGSGFAWQQWQASVPDGESPQGRGVLLMQLYGFQVAYNSTGNVLVLTMSLQLTP